MSWELTNQLTDETTTHLSQADAVAFVRETNIGARLVGNDFMWDEVTGEAWNITQEQPETCKVTFVISVVDRRKFDASLPNGVDRSTRIRHLMAADCDKSGIADPERFNNNVRPRGKPGKPAQKKENEE